jgi:UrcA family protein
MSRKLASIFTAVAIAAAAIAPASAEQRVQINTVAVSYADLDLTRAEGVKTLTLRLKGAVDQVCGRSATSASMTIRRKVQACREKAMDVAVAEINAPLLTAMHEAGESARFARL